MRYSKFGRKSALKSGLFSKTFRGEVEWLEKSRISLDFRNTRSEKMSGISGTLELDFSQPWSRLFSTRDSYNFEYLNCLMENTTIEDD